MPLDKLYNNSTLKRLEIIQALQLQNKLMRLTEGHIFRKQVPVDLLLKVYKVHGSP